MIQEAIGMLPAHPELRLDVLLPRLVLELPEFIVLDEEQDFVQVSTSHRTFSMHGGRRL